MRRVLPALVILAICLVSFFHLISPINDFDFFWHLKTGEWIWQHKSLPAEDPFSFTTQGHRSEETHIILTSYWISQVFFYLFNAAGGMFGIVISRFVIAGMLIYVMLKREKGDNLLYGGVFLIFLTYFLSSFPLERPQVFSFLFFAVLLYLLENARDDDGDVKKRNTYFLIPPLMLTWANMHGGYILGTITIALYLALEGLKFLHPSLRPIKWLTYKRLAVCGGLGIILSFANPNTYHIFVSLLKGAGIGTSNNMEYQSTINAFRIFNDHRQILYWIILFLAFAGFIKGIKKADLTEILILAGTGFFSFTTIRYIPFFMIAAIPFVGRSFSTARLLKPARASLLIVSIIAAIIFTWDARDNVENLTSGDWVNTVVHPVRAAEFVIANNLRGNMYNHYNFGGYLIWRLAPERKVFIDERNMLEDVYKQSQLVDSASKNQLAGLPAWRAIIQTYSIQYVITPFYGLDGGASPLVFALLHERDWFPVFADYNSVIFVKDSPLNSEAIINHSIPKEKFIDNLIELCDGLIAAIPKAAAYYIAKGDLYLGTSRFRDAAEAYEKAAQIAPFNADLREKIESLNRRRN